MVIRANVRRGRSGGARVPPPASGPPPPTPRDVAADHDASLDQELARVDTEFDEAVRRSEARSEGTRPPES
ncbi:hypothetical protein ACFQ46_14635 [Kineococcus sp. GCM10028916]|uniref:hypothetical protein n=1 Tax=Kineococcus sp. GCM10028916 TaxID=3273394 RepID=UPI0036323BF4